MDSHASLLSQFDFLKFAAMVHHVLVLDTHSITAPVLAKVSIVVVLGLESSSKGFHVLHILLSHSSQSNAGCCLHVAKSAEGSLTLGEAEWHLLLAAKSW